MAEIEVILECPSCRHRWHAATITEGAWWSAGTSPEICAKQCYCVQCDHAPPLAVFSAEVRGGLVQLELFT